MGGEPTAVHAYSGNQWKSIRNAGEQAKYDSYGEHVVEVGYDVVGVVQDDV